MTTKAQKSLGNWHHEAVLLQGLLEAADALGMNELAPNGQACIISVALDRIGTLADALDRFDPHTQPRPTPPAPVDEAA